MLLNLTFNTLPSVITVCLQKRDKKNMLRFQMVQTFVNLNPNNHVCDKYVYFLIQLFVQS